MNNVETYPLEEDEEKKKFSFQSIGKEDIIKTVEYTFLQDFGIGGLYNLGFGDFDPATGLVDDDDNSNNDDIYTVLGTVLSTVPKFFADNPYDTITVQGSDSGPVFVQHCKQTCVNKRCVGTTCRKEGRRIRTYRYFVDKNYEELNKTYSFFGYIRALKRRVPYQAHVKYDAVFVSKRYPVNFVSS